MPIYLELCFQELQDFIIYEETVRKSSPHTIYNYYRDLMLFFRYMKYIKGKTNPEVMIDDIYINDIDSDFLRSIDYDDIQRYFDYLTNIRQNGISTINRRVISLRTFFKYLYIDLQIIERNPTDKLMPPRVDKNPPEFLLEEECVILLNSIDGPEKERDYCIFVLFLNSGLRLSELVKLNDTDIDKNGNVMIWRKGNEGRQIIFNRACLEAIEEYRKYKEKIFEGKSYDHHAIFVGRHGKRLTARWIEEIVKKRMTNAGFGGRELSPHKLRHSAAMAMYRRGADIQALQQILGHKNPNATQVYTHTPDSKIKAAMTESPIERKKKK